MINNKKKAIGNTGNMNCLNNFNLSLSKYLAKKIISVRKIINGIIKK